MSSPQWLESLQWRYATKIFDSSKKVSDKDWNLLEESVVLAPSSYGLQPYKFLVVKNPEMRNKLREFSWGQSQVTDASHFLVFLGRESIDESWIRKFIQRTATVRNMKVEDLKAYEEMMIGDLVKGPRAQIAKSWAQRQAYIAMGFLMETAALMKIDTCPMEGLDPSKYDELLKLKGTGWTTMAAVAIGYRADSDAYAQRKKVRFERSDLFEVI